MQSRHAIYENRWCPHGVSCANDVCTFKHPSSRARSSRPDDSHGSHRQRCNTRKRVPSFNDNNSRSAWCKPQPYRLLEQADSSTMRSRRTSPKPYNHGSPCVKFECAHAHPPEHSQIKMLPSLNDTTSRSAWRKPQPHRLLEQTVSSTMRSRRTPPKPCNHGSPCVKFECAHTRAPGRPQARSFAGTYQGKSFPKTHPRQRKQLRFVKREVERKKFYVGQQVQAHVDTADGTWKSAKVLRVAAWFLTLKITGVSEPVDVARNTGQIKECHHHEPVDKVNRDLSSDFESQFPPLQSVRPIPRSEAWLKLKTKSDTNDSTFSLFEKQPISYVE